MVLMIPSVVGDLEAHLRKPEGELRGAAVLCHPHPVYGGTMDNRVVYRAAKSAAKAGFAALRFNFRGAGKSAGQYDQGLGEKEDVATVIDWIEREYSEKPLALLGYSFGAWVGLQVGCLDRRIRSMIGIGLPLDLYDFEFLLDYPNPALYIVGTRDEFCSGGNLERLARRLPPSSRIQRIQDADHFFSRHIEEVETLIYEFLKELPADRVML